MKTMAHAIVGTLIITVHTAKSPSQDEWGEYIRALETLTRELKDHTHLRNIVFTDGGAPDSVQRKAVNSIVASRSVTSAIVSRSQMVRTVVTAFSWFNEKVKAFSPDTIEEAYQHLKLSAYEIEVINNRVKQLRAQIDRG